MTKERQNDVIKDLAAAMGIKMEKQYDNRYSQSTGTYYCNQSRPFITPVKPL